MKFENIRSQIFNLIADRYVIDDNAHYEEELKNLAQIDLIHKWIFRIKRKGIQSNSWKTLVFIEIETDNEESTRREFKKAVNWIAFIKESLLGEENTDLYMFLALSNSVSEEECLRIESTEQFCRKYVLLPNEEISDFLNRTFLQKLLNNLGDNNLDDPIEKAFSKTIAQHNWLTPELKRTWIKAFSELSGSELADAILKGEITL